MYYYYPNKDFMAKIEELRWHFQGKDLLGKLHFIDKLQTRPPIDVRQDPRYRRFVNECIRSYNTEIRQHNSQVRLQEMRIYFRSLDFPTKLGFIRKLQAKPPEIRNHPKYRIFANECIREYNAEARRHNERLIELERARDNPPPIAAPPRRIVKKRRSPDGYESTYTSEPPDAHESNWKYDPVEALLDARVEELHYNGASCSNCRHLGRQHCNDFGRILPRWMDRGYNVCQIWEPR